MFYNIGECTSICTSNKLSIHKGPNFSWTQVNFYSDLTESESLNAQDGVFSKYCTLNSDQCQILLTCLDTGVDSSGVGATMAMFGWRWAEAGLGPLPTIRHPPLTTTTTTTTSWGPVLYKGILSTLSLSQHRSRAHIQLIMLQKS